MSNSNSTALVNGISRGGALNLASGSAVTGALPIANGGTNATSFAQSGGAIYYNGTKLTTDASTAFINYNGSGSTGIGGTYNASFALAVTGTSTFSAAATINGILTGNNIVRSAITATGNAIFSAYQTGVYEWSFGQLGSNSAFVINNGGGFGGTNILTITTVGAATFSSSLAANSLSLTTALPVSSGGTGVASVTTTPTATSFAGWDANKNLTSNNLIDSYTSTATGATTTTLTISSTCQQYFTGSTTQTVVLPVVSTLVTGFQFVITNLSTGVVTVQSSGNNTLQAMAANSQLIATCISTTGTGTASWNWNYQLVQNSITTLTSLGIFSGKTSISSSSTSQAVVFSTAYSGTSYSITANLLNTSDINPQFQAVTITAQSSTGFTTTWDVPTANANYVLSWQAIANN